MCIRDYQFFLQSKFLGEFWKKKQMLPTFPLWSICPSVGKRVSMSWFVDNVSVDNWLAMDGMKPIEPSGFRLMGLIITNGCC